MSDVNKRFFFQIQLLPLKVGEFFFFCFALNCLTVNLLMSLITGQSGDNSVVCEFCVETESAHSVE